MAVFHFFFKLCKWYQIAQNTTYMQNLDQKINFWWLWWNWEYTSVTDPFLTFWNISGSLCAETFYWIDKTLLKKLWVNYLHIRFGSNISNLRHLLKPKKNWNCKLLLDQVIGIIETNVSCFSRRLEDDLKTSSA